MSNNPQGLLNKLGGISKEINDYRAETEARHKDKPQLDRIEALLVDLVMILFTEFYIRPRFKDEDGL